MLQATKHWFFMLFHHHEWEVYERGEVLRPSDKAVT